MALKAEFLKHAWVSGILISGIGGILTILLDRAIGFIPWTTLSLTSQYLRQWLSTPLNIPIWALVSLLVAVCVLTWALLKIIKYAFAAKKPKMSEQELKIRNYTQDTFDGFKFRWDWKKDINGVLSIENIVCYCPNCNNYLINGECIGCERRYTRPELVDFEKFQRKVFANLKSKLDVELSFQLEKKGATKSKIMNNCE